VLDRALTSVYTARTPRLQRSPARHATVRAHEHDVLLPHDGASGHTLGTLLTSMSVVPNFLRFRTRQRPPSAIKAALWNIACMGTPTSPKGIPRANDCGTMD